MQDWKSRAAGDDTEPAELEPIAKRWERAARALAQAIWQGKPYSEHIRELMLLRSEEAARQRSL